MIPIFRIDKGLAHDRKGEGRNHSGRFGYGDEIDRFDQFATGVIPSCEDFEPDEIGAANAVLRLIEGNKFTLRNTLPHIGFHFVALLHLVFHRGLEARYPLAPGPFCLVHGDIASPKQIRDTGSGLDLGVNAHGGANLAYASPDRNGFAECVLYRFGDRQRIFGAGSLSEQQYRKFVAAETSAGRVFRCNLEQPVGHFFQHFVAGLMPVKVIDLFEIVEIHVDQGDFFARTHLLVDYFDYARAVPQSGSIVPDGNHAYFPLGVVCCLRVPGQHLRTPPDQQYQGDVEQKRDAEGLIQNDRGPENFGDCGGQKQTAQSNEHNNGTAKRHNIQKV